MARKYSLSVTTSAQSFGGTTKPGRKRDFIFQNLTSSAGNLRIDCNGNTADADGFTLEPGQAVTNKDLPECFRQGPYSTIGDSTATLQVQFSNERG